MGFVSFDPPLLWKESLVSCHDGQLVSGWNGHLLNCYNNYFELVICLIGSKIKTIQKIHSEKSHFFPGPPSLTDSHMGNHYHFCLLCILPEFFIVIKIGFPCLSHPFF